MAFYRTVSMSFWTDSKVVDDFTPEDKYFYLYLFTNPHTNLCGCYELSIKQAVNETGYNRDTIESLINRFETFHKVIIYSRETKEILLLNWHKYNWTKSEKYNKALETEISKVKEEKFKEYLLGVLRGEDTVSIPYRYPMDTSNTTTNTITNTNSNNRGVKRGELITKANISEPVKEKLCEWLEYKKERREGYKEMGLKSLITQAQKYEQQYGAIAVIDIIGCSMASGYRGIVWDRLDKGTAKKTYTKDEMRKAAEYLDNGGTFLGGLFDDQYRNSEDSRIHPDGVP